MGEQTKTFKEALKEYKSKLSNIQLPDLNMAMHPTKVYFTDDISNKERFNEHFIESHINEGMSAFAIYLMVGMHNFLLPWVIFILFFMDGIETDPVMYFFGGGGLSDHPSPPNINHKKLPPIEQLDNQTLINKNQPPITLVSY